MATSSICTIEDCARPLASHGMCNFHRRRLKRGVDLYAPSIHASRGLPAAFMYGVIGTTEQACIKWPFATNGRDGRGVIKIEGVMRQVHREVCQMVHGDPPTSAHEAAHLCGKGHEACINPNHLAWKTSAENKADMNIHGTRRRGSAAPGAKLTEESVREIRKLASTGVSQHSLAACYGVSQGVVWKVIHGVTWTHVQSR